MFDEESNAGAEHLDPASVARYDAKQAFDPAEEVALLGGARVVVDMGAGTGAFAAAAAAGRRVVAVDPSPAMVAAIAARAAGVEVVRAGFLTYEHTGAPPDYVYSRHALHHLPDFWKAVALERIGRLLRRGGVLRLRDLVFSFDPDEADEVLEAWYAGAGGGGYTREDLQKDVREEHITFSWLLEPMLERAGFEVRDAAYADSRVFAAYTCVRR